MPLRKDIKKVLVIGSGPIIIGQAAEFDYAGTQACRTLKQEGLEVVLINSNPATIMTDKAMADKVYIEPLTLDVVKKIIKIEKPDSILSTLGGQTGLTLSMQLAECGFLAEQGVKLLGANPETIHKAEDRQAFKDTMEKIGEPCIPSKVVETVDDAVDFAEVIDYPVIVRPAFTLGGTGGGIAYNEDELRDIATNGLRLSPITQILVEKCISGWKEIEFEVIRDSKGNVITVCSMENFDPVGVHTGDSIVIAPAVSLTDREYQMLRTAALNIVSELKVEGGCNCQFALHPTSFEYAVIEVNPRVSRSSALASKATGYPIAKVASKIAIGYSLDEIVNQVTGNTYACFEPAVDYCVVKFPKWAFDKFVYAKRTLGTQMMATGEVMSIGTSFEQAMMKAVRSIELGLDTMNLKKLERLDDAEIRSRLYNVDDERAFVVFEALKRNISIDTIHEITKIDRWFISKLNNLVELERYLADGELTEEKYDIAKKYGYLDSTIERISGQKCPKRTRAVFKMVDTCAGEFKAETPYFYSTFDEENEAKQFIENNDTGKKKIIVFGSGPIRIGQGIEFDYCSVHCVWALKEMGYEAVICNNNPETVSTDFDTGDRLYFDPLTREDVEAIIETEKPYGVVVQFGGQTAIKLTKHLSDMGVNILGTSADSIDAAEDRERFDELLNKCGIPRPEGFTVMNTEEALKAAEQLGYPVLMRPSYVLGGQNMIIAHSNQDIIEYMEIIMRGGLENPVLIDKYMMGKEVEVDAICDGTDYVIPGIMEHIERAGIHSGDSISVYPALTLTKKTRETIIEYTRRLAMELKVIGLVNIQYVVYNDEVYVIEVNPRSSRTVPYISKVTGVPMVDVATKIMLGESLKDQGYTSGLYKEADFIAVKVPVFSFEKLHDVDTALGPEMKSTGECLGIA
ncbi:MAG: carbamoyl-phosphate synthase large subunit, partial [Oscillospiraceae bacterium]|nr:carbamoyl-phosphate synthase large subunit [Oscillospiraceae bacterium]